MANGWTAERRQRQAALIQIWEPWKRSTGPRTIEGKATASKNVAIGLANKAKALKQAQIELSVALAKIHALTGTDKAWWEYL
jgi:hypothetical protein